MDTQRINTATSVATVAPVATVATLWRITYRHTSCYAVRALSAC